MWDRDKAIINSALIYGSLVHVSEPNDLGISTASVISGDRDTYRVLINDPDLFKEIHASLDKTVLVFCELKSNGTLVLSRFECCLN